VDEPAKELLRRSVHEFLLPIGELDPAMMLSAAAVLREQDHPRMPRATDDHAVLSAWGTPRVDPTTDRDPLNRRLAFRDDSRICGIQRGSQRPRGSVPGQAAIAEIHPERYA
jgi:hypothetical protein